MTDCHCWCSAAEVVKNNSRIAAKCADGIVMRIRVGESRICDPASVGHTVLYIEEPHFRVLTREENRAPKYPVDLFGML